jgi:hypothetical protein
MQRIIKTHAKAHVARPVGYADNKLEMSCRSSQVSGIRNHGTERARERVSVSARERARASERASGRARGTEGYICARIKHDRCIKSSKRMQEGKLAPSCVPKAEMCHTSFCGNTEMKITRHPPVILLSPHIILLPSHFIDLDLCRAGTLD